MSTQALPPPAGPIPFWVQAMALLIAVPTVMITAAVGIAFTGYADGVVADRTTHLSAPLPPDGIVHVAVVAGGITVEAGPDEEVTVDDRVEIRAITRDLARRALDSYTLSTLSTTPDGVAVSVGAEPFAFATSISRRLTTVHVPARARVAIRMNNGAAMLRQLSGDLDVQSDNGAFDFEDVVVTGSTRAWATNGAINFQGRMAGGSLDLRTTNGAINIVLPATTSAIYRLQAIHGPVNAEPPEGTVQNQNGFGRTLTGVLGDGSQGSIVARTTSGAVNLDARG